MLYGLNFWPEIMQMRWFSRLLPLFLAFFLLAGAGPKQTFEELKQHYLSLRNSDPAVTRPDEWRGTGNALEEFADENRDAAVAAPALLYAAIVSSTLGEKQKDGKAAKHAADLLEELVKDYPQSDLADDALVMLGDISSRNGDAEKAKEFYSRVVSEYPQGDMVEVANQRMKGDAFDLPFENLNDVPGKAKIAIDAGHGGEDRGAVGQGNLFEKDVSFSLALEIQNALEGLGYEVILTRDSDQFAPLAERMTLANSENADVFVSLHSNASPSHRLSGVETYILDASTDEAAEKLAERENAAVGGEQPQDLQRILSELIQKGKKEESKKLATLVHRQLLASIKAGKHPLPDLGVEKGPFYVLVGAHMPCVLMEIGFIDNERDAALLADPDFRSEAAQGIARGIDMYLSERRR